ncbi:MAG: hypothetical protein V2I26_09175 [Halieaceae bacterium]|jgi:hypothetical protein|nr:hypothetical protein [Halieaceae bacterium]
MSLQDLISGEPFSYISTKNGLVEIACKDKKLATLRGQDACRFLAGVEHADQESVQLAMAKATGQFKHGTERASRNARK